MDSRRIFSYRWRLFVVLAVTLWTAIGVMAVWQYQADTNMMQKQVRKDLSMASQRMVNAYERNYNPLPYMDFVAHNYAGNAMFRDVRISVYLDGRMYYNMGAALPYETDMAEESGLETPEYNEALGLKPFYYSVQRSGDNRLTVIVMEPYNAELYAATTPSAEMFLGMLVVAVVLTLVAYISTRRLGRSIDNLSKFTRMVASNSQAIPDMKFPKDELGELSRQIVDLYTERRRGTERLRREHTVAMNAMEEKSRVKRQMTSNINHELKTPIGVIKGYLDTIIQNPDMDEATRTHFISKSLEHVNRLVTLINDISSITRLEEGANVIATEELDYHDVIYTVASEIQESGEIGNMEFVYDVPMNCRVEGNFTLLTAMLHNLAKNAAAYSKGTECGVIYAGGDERMEHFIFYDNGRGVGEEHLPHLFERFYRIDSGRARKSGGTGLGLPIVESTIRAHGGTIEVYNRPEGGLAFRFTLLKSRRKNQKYNR